MIFDISIPPLLKRILRILIWISTIIISLLIVISLLLLIPSVQNTITEKATKIISEKAGMKVEIGSIHIAFPKAIKVGGVFIEDHESDTLFYCEKMVMNTDLIPLIRQKINIDYLLIDGLNANIYKNGLDSSFNFSPLLAVFSSKEKEAKENPKSAWKIGFDELELKNIKAEFYNRIDSSGISLHLGRLLIEANSAELIPGKFDVERIDLQETSLSILLAKNSDKVKSIQTKNETPGLPIEVQLEELNLNNIHFSLISGHEELSLFADVHQANLKPKTLDLKSFNIELEQLQADGVDVVLKILPGDSTYQQRESLPTNEIIAMHDFTFGNFPWTFSIDEVNISKTSYKMDLDAKERDSSGMDYRHMAFRDFNVLADSAFFNKNNTGAKVKELRIKEVSGPELTNAEGEFFMNNKSILAKNVDISTLKSTVRGEASLGYSSLREIGKSIGKLQIIADLQGSIHLPDIRPFTSVLDQYPLLANFDQIEVNGVKVDGTLDNLLLKKCSAGLGYATAIEAKGFIAGLPSTDVNISMELDTLSTSLADAGLLFPDSLLPAQLILPENIGLSGAFHYMPDSMDVDLNLKTKVGELFTKVQLTGEDLSSIFQIKSLDVGQLLNDSIYGDVSLEGALKSTQSDGVFRDFSTLIDIQSIVLLENTYHNIHMDMEKKDNLFSLYSSIEDSLISLTAQGEAELHNPSNHYNLEINLKNADLQGMNILKEYFEISGNIDINTNFTSIDDNDGTLILSDILLTNSFGNYEINEMKLVSDIKKEYTNFNFTSDILNSSLTGNTKIDDLKTAFYNQIGHYFAIPDSLLSDKEYHFEFDLSINDQDFIANFLFDELQGIAIENCHAMYDGVNDLFEVDIRIPQFNYANWQLDDLSLKLTSQRDTILSYLELGQFSYDSAIVKNIVFSTKFAEQNANLLLAVHDALDSLKYSIETNVAYEDSTYIVRLKPDNFILDHQRWYVSPENRIFIKNRDLHVQSALLSNNNQKIWLESMNDHLKLNLEEFRLQNITSILDRDKQLLKGKINGYLDIVDLFGLPLLTSNLNINGLSFHERMLGNLSVFIDYRSDEELNYSLNLTNDVNYINFEGRSDLESPYKSIEARLITDVPQAEVFSGFLDEYLTDLRGGITGNIEITGEADNLKLNGGLNFNNLFLTSKAVNASLITNGSLLIEDNLLKFNDFKISDSLQNLIYVKGSIDAGNYMNPKFDVKLTSPEFMLINSKDSKSKTVVGKFFVGMDIDLQGSMSNPVVNSSFSVNKKTDIMYKLPGKELELITDDGVVVFTDFNNSQNAVLIEDESQFFGDSLMSKIYGIDLTVNLEIDPQARFNIYINPNSGDNTSFKLKGYLQYKYNDTQRGHLNGLVELEEGFYDLSFYGLVKKKFIYDPGSTISWSGNVMDGDINFSARYEVKTNSVGLVSNEISSAEKKLYNQRLPYEVILKINEQLSNPKISFGIDLLDRYKNDNPTIASKLNMLEQPSMESERNKQVFALLVAGTFIPDNPDTNEGSSSSNFATTAAINSVNAIMTQQLNNLTGQFIKGFDVDMGVNTFDDYASGTAETRKQLDVKVSKNLFNDRVSAEVESHIDLEGANTNPGTQSTAGMTEFAVSYQLTNSGNYRIKVFRENAWDLFDGEIQNSGIAFIFVKEFDKLKRKQKDAESKLSGDNSLNDSLLSPE